MMAAGTSVAALAPSTPQRWLLDVRRFGSCRMPTRSRRRPGVATCTD